MQPDNSGTQIDLLVLLVPACKDVLGWALEQSEAFSISYSQYTSSQQDRSGND
jgi:hypothetical protein